MEENTTPKLLDTAELAAALGLRQKTLENWRTAGDGPPFIKIGRLVKYDPADVSEWRNSRRVRSTSDRPAGGR